MKWTKELLQNKWIIVNSQEEYDQISSFIESFGIPKWDNHRSNYQFQLSGLHFTDFVIIIICEKEYIITQYQLQKSGLETEDELTLEDLFPKEDLKSKLIELFSKPETIFYLRSIEEASRLDKLLTEINYLDMNYIEKDTLTNWYQKDECDKLCMMDIYNANYKNLDNLKVIEITFDNLLDHVK